MPEKTYENFPLWIPTLAILISLSVYAIGAYILSGFGILFSVLYLLYCLWVELRVIQMSCVNCYYYGKVCAFGKGKLCSLFFKKGDPKMFLAKKISWVQILPDFLVFILPLVGGIILLVMGFSWILAGLLALLTVIFLGGTGFIRGSCACKFCKQRELGCLAEKLFSKRK
ncbi:MAG: hypothetical protein NTY20_04520 [Candidatus Aenigmarchaeota archaeon]|nr:hypothetical protein [Candidatus Aenigmarchaeota archaeon]